MRYLDCPCVLGMGFEVFHSFSLQVKRVELQVNNSALLHEVEFSVYVFGGWKNSIFGVCVNLRIKINATQPLLVHCHKSKKKNRGLN